MWRCNNNTKRLCLVCDNDDDIACKKRIGGLLFFVGFFFTGGVGVGLGGGVMGVAMSHVGIYKAY